jgi:hypothetical protein
MIFDHIGMVTTEKKDDENWVESTRVWVTNPKTHPFSIEWLRYADDSEVSGPLREQAHVSYRVEDLTKAAGDMKVLLEPFIVGGFIRVGFYQTTDGAVVELMEYFGDENEWFPDSKE